MNDIPTPSSHPCQENSSFGAFVSRVEAWDIPAIPKTATLRFPENHTKTTPSGGVCPPFRGAHFGHYGGLKRWWGGAGKDIQTAFSAKIQELWKCHDMGMSSREIARELGWRSHASVLYHLKRGRPAPQPSRWSMATEGPPRHDSSTIRESTNLLQREQAFDLWLASAGPHAGRFTESRAYKSALEANLRNNKARIDRWSMAE